MEDTYTEIGNELATALVRKVPRKNGARLEIRSPATDRKVYLDALLLEGLSWQTPHELASALGSPPEVAGTEEDERVDVEEGYIEIGNEFATALVRKVRLGDGARLEICSPKLDYRIYLTPPLLESLTRQTSVTLSRFLEKPYGPRGTHEGPDGLVNFE